MASIHIPLDFVVDKTSSWIRPNPNDNGNNGILFLALCCWMQAEKYNGKERLINFPRINEEQDIFIAYSEVKNHFRANPPEDTDHFSIDNMTGLYALYELQSRYEMQRYGYVSNSIKLHYAQLPVFRWNNRTWLHPNGWMIFLSLRYWPLRYLFMPFITLMALWSALASDYKDTTGFNLWYLRLCMLGGTFYLLLFYLFEMIIEYKFAKHSDETDNALSKINNIIIDSEDTESFETELELYSGFELSFFYYFTNGWNWISYNQLCHPALNYIINNSIYRPGDEDNKNTTSENN